MKVRFDWLGTKCRQPHSAATTRVYDAKKREAERFYFTTIGREKATTKRHGDGRMVHRDGSIRAVRNF
jgi:hypothetical protein